MITLSTSTFSHPPSATCSATVPVALIPAPTTAPAITGAANPPVATVTAAIAATATTAVAVAIIASL